MNNIFNLYPQEKVAVFIDGANTHEACKSLDFSIDYKILLKYIRGNAHLVRAFYYTAMLNTGEDHNPMRKLVDWLSYNGFHVVTKLAKEFRGESGVVRTKGNMDIELATDLLTMVPHYDVALLFSGDGDFRRVVEEIQKQGKRVIVVSSYQTKPSSFVADELRRQCDEFVDLADIMEEIQKNSFATSNLVPVG